MNIFSLFVFFKWRGCKRRIRYFILGSVRKNNQKKK